MKLKTNIINWLLATVILFASSCQAALITLTPSSQDVDIFQSVSVDVFISDLSDTQALSAFDFELLYDPSIVSFNSVTFGSELGFSYQDTLSLGSGLQAILESSFEAPEDLLDLQLNQFLLFTVNFVSTGFGETLISLQNVLLGDENGLEITNVSFTSADINVIPSSVVSEPSHFAICLFGLSILAYRRRKMKI